MKEYHRLKTIKGVKHVQVSTSRFLFMDGLRKKTYFLELSLYRVVHNLLLGDYQGYI